MRGGLVARPCRAGLTLLEVVVSLAIFLFSIAAIAELIRFSTNSALDAQHKTQALFLAQAKLAELAAGAQAMEAQGETPFDHDPDYTWSLQAQEGEVAGLWDVTVTVARQRGNGTRIEVSLTQWILDPSLRGTTIPAATSGTTTGGTANGGTTSGGTTTPSGGNSP